MERTMELRVEENDGRERLDLNRTAQLRASCFGKEGGISNIAERESLNPTEVPDEKEAEDADCVVSVH